MGMMIACNWPISLNRWMAMVMVTTAISPTNQLHQGVAASTWLEGTIGMPASIDTSSNANVDTENETSVET